MMRPWPSRSAGTTDDQSNHISTGACFALGVLALLTFLAYLDFVDPSGDVSYYANIIESRSFDQLTLHQGYYVIGHLVSAAIGSVFGTELYFNLTVLAAIFGALATVVAYLLFLRWFDTTIPAVVALLLLLTSQRFFNNATSPEIYMVQAFFIWSAFLAYDLRKPVAAGFLFALAIWVTPLTVFFGLYFPAVSFFRRRDIRQFLLFVFATCLAYTPFFYVYYPELLWGTRGILVIDAAKSFELLPAFKSFVKFQFYHYSFALFLAAPALVAIWRHKELAWLTSVVFVPNIYVLAQIRSEYNVFALPLDIFFAFWLAAGFAWLADRNLTWVASLAIVSQLGIFAADELVPPGWKNREYPTLMRHVGTEVRDHDSAIFVGDWADRIAFVYFNRRNASFPIEEGTWYARTVDIDELDDRSISILRDADKLTVSESYESSFHARLFLPEEELVRRHEALSSKRRIENILQTECIPLALAPTKLFECKTH